MRKWELLIAVIFLSLFFLPKKARAAYFKLEPNNVSKDVNQSFTLDVYVDSGTEEIRGVDIYLSFDGNLLSAESVSAGSFFSTVTNNITSNEVYISGVMDDVSTKTGLGKVASVTFKGKSGGSGTISFNCDKSVIAKGDVNATNILDCSSNITSNVTISGGSSNNNSENNQSNQTNPPTSLPQTGIIDRMKDWAIFGVVFLFIGGLLKFVI